MVITLAPGYRTGHAGIELPWLPGPARGTRFAAYDGDRPYSILRRRFARWRLRLVACLLIWPLSFWDRRRPCSGRRPARQADEGAVGRRRRQGRGLSEVVAERGRQLESDAAGTARRHRRRRHRVAPAAASRPTTNRPRRDLKYIEGLVNPKAGHIAGPDPKVHLQNYVTSRQRDGPGRRQPGRQVQGRHRRRGQVPQEAAVGRRRRARSRKDDFFGGAGYDSKSRPDLSNTQFFLDALKAAGVSGRTTRPSRRPLSSSAAART